VCSRQPRLAHSVLSGVNLSASRYLRSRSHSYAIRITSDAALKVESLGHSVMQHLRDL
jgi:hypothetical protein